LYLIITIAASLLVTDPGGNPIPGAWVGWDAMWYGQTDTNGLYEPTGEEPDRITMHAPGCRD